MASRSLLAAALLLLGSCVNGSAGTRAAHPHIVFILADDLGWYDTSVYGDQSDAAKAASGNLTGLADDGVRLRRHYTHWHCSPTRRSFLSGRSPLHHGEDLSGIATDNLDLRWTWISEVLADKGYIGHWYGKGHTGYQSMRHLPANRGFAGGSVLFLSGSGSYYTLPRMNGTAPLYTAGTDPQEYSTDLFGSLAVRAIEAHDASKPMFLYLPWQAVHTPYDLPPEARGAKMTGAQKIRTMITDVDRWVGAVKNALKAKGMYDNTLLVFTADNGGTGSGNNHPLRGGKHSNWEGGMRTQTFISGGYVPAGLRGTSNDNVFHVSDWYPTFCGIVGGADCTDASPVAPLPVDPADPTKDIYRDDADCWPAVDGVDIWPSITQNGVPPARKHLWLSREAMIMDGRYKIVVAQQLPGLAAKPDSGWQRADGSWYGQGKIDGKGCGLAFKNRTHFTPCLFDLRADEREEHDLAAADPTLLETLWAQLNATQLTAFTARSPPALKGPCDATCSAAYWKAAYGAAFAGPECGVPGCS